MAMEARAHRRGRGAVLDERTMRVVVGGAKRPRRIPKLIARLVAGAAAAEMATSLRGASNAKAKRELGWEPLHASWRQGFREALG